MKLHNVPRILSSSCAFLDKGRPHVFKSQNSVCARFSAISHPRKFPAARQRPPCNNTCHMSHMPIAEEFGARRRPSAMSANSERRASVPLIAIASSPSNQRASAHAITSTPLATVPLLLPRASFFDQQSWGRRISTRNSRAENNTTSEGGGGSTTSPTSQASLGLICRERFIEKWEPCVALLFSTWIRRSLSSRLRTW